MGEWYEIEVDEDKYWLRYQDKSTKWHERRIEITKEQADKYQKLYFEQQQALNKLCKGFIDVSNNNS